MADKPKATAGLKLGDVVVFVAHNGDEHPATVHSVKSDVALDLVVHDGYPGVSRDVPVEDKNAEDQYEVWRKR